MQIILTILAFYFLSVIGFLIMGRLASKYLDIVPTDEDYEMCFMPIVNALFICLAIFAFIASGVATLIDKIGDSPVRKVFHTFINKQKVLKDFFQGK